MNTSLVCKAWLSAGRLPTVWGDGLDLSRLNRDTKKLNMTSFLKILERPQFVSVKAIALPYNVKLGKNSLKKLASLLPSLELLDTGYYHSGTHYSQKMNCTDADLVSITEHFTTLTSLRIDMSAITSNGIDSAARAMGERLLELKASSDTISKNYLSEQNMETISSSCPNLKHFEYRSGSCNHYNSSLDGVTGDRVVSLVEACRGLESLTLYGAHNVKATHFLQLANLVGDNLNDYALRKIVAFGYSARFNSDHPFDIKTLLAPYNFLEVDDKFVHPRLDKGIMFWSRRGEGPTPSS